MDQSMNKCRLFVMTKGMVLGCHCQSESEEIGRIILEAINHAREYGAAQILIDVVEPSAPDIKQLSNDIDIDLPSFIDMICLPNERFGLEVVSKKYNGEGCDETACKSYIFIRHEFGDFPILGLTVGEEPLSIKKAVSLIEPDLIRKALKKTEGNRTAAAKLLELSHRALLYKIREYKIGD